jgi:hypothetical protein
MFMLIAFLFVYFALLTRMKQVVELNRKYNKVVQKSDSEKNDDFLKKDIIDQLQGNYQMEYIHLFERV